MTLPQHGLVTIVSDPQPSIFCLRCCKVVAYPCTYTHVQSQSHTCRDTDIHIQILTHAPTHIHPPIHPHRGHPHAMVHITIISQHKDRNTSAHCHLYPSTMGGWHTVRHICRVAQALHEAVKGLRHLSDSETLAGRCG